MNEYSCVKEEEESTSAAIHESGGGNAALKWLSGGGRDGNLQLACTDLFFQELDDVGGRRRGGDEEGGVNNMEAASTKLSSSLLLDDLLEFSDDDEVSLSKTTPLVEFFGRASQENKKTFAVGGRSGRGGGGNDPPPSSGATRTATTGGVYPSVDAYVSSATTDSDESAGAAVWRGRIRSLLAPSNAEVKCSGANKRRCGDEKMTTRKAPKAQTRTENRNEARSIPPVGIITTNFPPVTPHNSHPAFISSLMTMTTSSTGQKVLRQLPGTPGIPDDDDTIAIEKKEEEAFVDAVMRAVKSNPATYADDGSQDCARVAARAHILKKIGARRTERLTEQKKAVERMQQQYMLQRQHQEQEEEQGRRLERVAQQKKLEQHRQQRLEREAQQKQLEQHRELRMQPQMQRELKQLEEQQQQRHLKSLDQEQQPQDERQPPQRERREQLRMQPQMQRELKDLEQQRQLLMHAQMQRELKQFERQQLRRMEGNDGFQQEQGQHQQQRSEIIDLLSHDEGKNYTDSEFRNESQRCHQQRKPSEESDGILEWRRSGSDHSGGSISTMTNGTAMMQHSQQHMIRRSSSECNDRSPLEIYLTSKSTPSGTGIADGAQMQGQLKRQRQLQMQPQMRQQLKQKRRIEFDLTEMSTWRSSATVISNVDDIRTNDVHEGGYGGDDTTRFAMRSTRDPCLRATPTSVAEASSTSIPRRYEW